MRNIYPTMDGIYIQKAANRIFRLIEDLEECGIETCFDDACKIYELALLEQQNMLIHDLTYAVRGE